MEVSASWPGLEWRRASLAGSARSLSAKLNFRAACDPKSIRASLQASFGRWGHHTGDIALTLPSHALSGKFAGDIASLGAVTRELQPFVQQNRDSSLEPPVTMVLRTGQRRWEARSSFLLPPCRPQ